MNLYSLMTEVRITVSRKIQRQSVRSVFDMIKWVNYAISRTLEYEDEIINALPYGISAILLVDDDTTGMANVYRNDYAQMIADCSKAFETEAKGMM